MRKRLCYVRSVLTNRIIIVCGDGRQLRFLRSIGGKRRYLVRSEWVIKYSSDNKIIDLFKRLRNEGFLFSYDQHGWGPSDLFRYYRGKGLLAGKFNEIFWLGGGSYRIVSE